MQIFLFSDCKQICKFPFGDVPQNSFKIWEMTETKHQTKYQRCLVTCWNALFFNHFGGSKVTVNQCTASNVTAPEHNNQFGVCKKFIFCKAWLVMSASCRGFFSPKMTDTPTFCATCRAPTQTMSATSSRVGSSDAVSMSCQHDDYPTCLHMSAKNY